VVEKKTFEQSMAKLEEIVRRLETGDVSLDDSLKAFEKGIGYVRECEKKLDEAKGKIEKLVKQANGEVKTSSFEPTV